MAPWWWDRRLRTARTPADALFRRVFAINGLIFTMGTLALAISPATVSARIQPAEIPVLAIGSVEQLDGPGRPAAAQRPRALGWER